jgi:putative hydrolase of the HAD superfamily
LTASFPSTVRAVTFDYGQTLAELDTAFLSKRALEWGADVDATRLDAASPTAWRAYDEAKRVGKSGRDAWGRFMATLLSHAGVVSKDRPGQDVIDSLVEYLWEQQPRRNLWRRHIAGMKELVEDLATRGVRMAIVSNSEGRLAELLAEVGLHSYFQFVADSGLLSFEKPDPRIFEYAARGIGVAPSDTVHVGDAWVADIEGAVGVGARAIWVTPAIPAGHALPSGVIACRDAAEIRSALRALALPA